MVVAVQLKKLNLVTFIQNRRELYSLVDSNRPYLTPVFNWTDSFIIPNQHWFNLFIIISLCRMGRKKTAHIFKPTKLYDEWFIGYNSKNQIGGMCGLYDIDTARSKSAELWGFSFRGNTETIETVKILEDYCINKLGLESIYGKVCARNRASRLFWERYGYDERNVDERRVLTSDDIYIYSKKLSR